MRIIDSLPRIYQIFLPAFFWRTIPRESHATCEDCAMTQNSESFTKRDYYFSEDRKCCTYSPFLPNYLVGAILQSSEQDLAKGRDLIQKKILSRKGVTPQGLHPPRTEYLLMLHNKTELFGKTQDLLCPYFDIITGQCSIWPYRNAICTTWFCKFNAGEDGRLFWSALKKYLAYTENCLMFYTLYSMKLITDQFMDLHSKDSVLELEGIHDSPIFNRAYKALWGDWAGREDDFYKEAYDRVSSLKRKKFSGIGGISQKIMLRELSRSHQNLIHPRVPKILMRNPKLVVTKLQDNSYMLSGYSACDPLKVPSKIYDIISLFDGTQSNREVLQLIKDKRNTKIELDLLKILYLFRILIAGEQDDNVR